jgi:hypothetical protein
MMIGKKVVGTIKYNNMEYIEYKIWYTIDCNGNLWCSKECPKGLNLDGTLNFTNLHQDDYDKCPEQWKKLDMLKNLKINESKPIIIKIKK